MPYKHSGRFTPIGLAIGIGAALVAAVPLGWLYTWLMMVTTYIKLRAIEAIAFGALVGVAAGYGLVAGKVRNNAIALGVGALGGTFAHYVGWAAFIQQMFAQAQKSVSALEVALNPAQMWRIVLVFNQYGTYAEEHSDPTTGVMLWIVWAAEALTVITMATVVAYAITDKAPFCETCDRWAKPEKPQFFQMTVGRDQFKAMVLDGKFDEIAKVPRATVKNPHFRIELHRCPGCNNLNTVSVAVGGTKQGAGSLLPKTLLPPDQAEKLRALASASPLARPAST